MPGRKKYGYLLLLFLVLSGLAGKPTNNSLTKKERVFAAEYLKTTRNDLVNEINNLTPKQLDYKKTSDKKSIRDYIFQIVYADKKFRELLDKTMKLPANPEKRSEIILTDGQIINLPEAIDFWPSSMKLLSPQKSPYKSVQEALHDFKTSRLHHIKYIKATSEDLRNHIIKTPIGWLDAYQLCLLISTQTNNFTRQLKLLKTQPGFPL
jgi:hypothetical protein